MNTKRWIVMLIVASLVLFPSYTILASGTEVEPNDSCVTAQDLGAIVLPFAFNGELAGSPLPSGDVDFFQFTSTPGVELRVDLEGSTTGMGTLYDPYLGYFDSGCNFIAQDDDGGDGLNSRLVITVPTDGIVILGVTTCCDGGFSEGGNGTYLLSVQEILPPPNDNFGAATSIPSLPFDDTMDTSMATVEAYEPESSCAYYGPIKTVWYTFTPATSGSISANVPSADFTPVITAYTGSSLANLVEVGCRNYHFYPLTLRTEANTTYYFQVGVLYPEQAGYMQFHLDVPPPPVAGICFYPSAPSALETVQFYDCSYDPVWIGLQYFTWEFGDEASSTESDPVHLYAMDGDYTVQHGVTTYDGRSASTSQKVQVRTHDVSVTKVLAPNTATVGQNKKITVSIKNNRYPETVRIELYRSVSGGWYQRVDSLTKSVPVLKGNRTTRVSFNYTFTQQDAQIGKVTFKVVATIENARDAFPFDNETISIPPTVIKRSISYPNPSYPNPSYPNPSHRNR